MSIDRPIPSQWLPDTPRIRALPIEDNGEPLVPASLAPDRVLARPRYHLEGLPGALPECFVRAGVWTRLLVAAEALPRGCRLVLFDTWRPVSLQRWLFERFVEECERDGAPGGEAESFVSRPMADSRTSPPYHLTGGAVDLSVADAAGRLLDMGTDFDIMTDASHTRAFEEARPDDARQRNVRANRRVLYHAMIDAGFVNLPSEWWHYDYGDQLWAWTRAAPHAIYGATRPAFRWGTLP